MSSKRNDPVSVGSVEAEILGEVLRNWDDSWTCPDCGAVCRKQFNDSPNVCVSDTCSRDRMMKNAKDDPWRYASIFGVPPGWKNKYKDARMSEIEGFDPGDRDVFIWGTTGTGKTHAMAALSYEILVDVLSNQIAGSEALGREGLQCLRWVYAPDLFMQLRESFREKSKSSELEIVSRYVAYDVLFLDDLFAEKTSGYTLSATDTILSKREQANRRTIITSNERIEEVSVSDPRIASKLSGYKAVKMTGADRRKERA